MKIMLKQSILISIVISVFAIPFLFASCRDDVKSSVNFEYDPEAIPKIKTDSVVTLISDSGIIRYKVVAQTWDMFEDAKDKYWYFPDGLYLEQFDTIFNVVVSVKADTAWNFINKRLWKLRGNVFIEKYTTGDTYSSPELYWDQQKKIMYSDSVVTVDQPGQALINATKFSANEQFTDVVFVGMGELSRKGKALIYVNEDKENDKGEEEIGEEKTE